ncbi:MAG: M15 family metallopeptidase [Pseudomonadota bacterium]
MKRPLATLLAIALVMATGPGTIAQVPQPKPERSPGNAAPQSGPAPAAASQAVRRTGFFGGLFGRRGAADKYKQALLDAYPGAFRFEGNEAVFPSGERIVWDDGRKKSPAELLTNADLEDMFAYPYAPASLGDRRPPRHHDPGRVRSDAFFKALYGGSADAVRATIREVPWVPRLGGGRLPVTTRFGVDKQFAAVSAEVERMPERFHKYLRPSAGAFLWRRIAGTNRMSVHSFGAAVDINTHYANYWRWDKQPAGGPVHYRNEIPIEIVAVFEKYCFIWGGRWYHYDTMHFEYRPELLPGCRKV